MTTIMITDTTKTIIMTIYTGMTTTIMTMSIIMTMNTGMTIMITDTTKTIMAMTTTIIMHTRIIPWRTYAPSSTRWTFRRR